MEAVRWTQQDLSRPAWKTALSAADALFDAADCVFAADANQRITFWSAASERLLGISRQQALGAPCHKLLRACDGAGQAFCGPACRIAQLAEGGSAPVNHRLWLDAGRRQRQQFRLIVMLAPSAHEGLWSVFHVLHRVAAGASVKSRATRADAPALTARERAVLQMLAEGLPAHLISRHLCISLVTVRNHIQHILAKLEVHSKVEAVALAYRRRLIRVPAAGLSA